MRDYPKQLCREYATKGYFDPTRKPEAAGRAHATKEREGGKAAQGNPGGKNSIDTL